MSIIQEFKEFAVKGNVMDLAIGVIIGGAFGKIIDSLVKDIFMPFITWILGGELDFTKWQFKLGAGADAPVLAYGNFITIFINFILLAWVVFLLVKLMNRLRLEKPVAEPEAVTPEDIALLREIRDELKRRP